MPISISCVVPFGQISVTGRLLTTIINVTMSHPIPRASLDEMHIKGAVDP